MRGERPAIDLDLARLQHGAYVEGLRAIGFEVQVLPPMDDLPDSCFVEDVALVLPEVTVLLRPGAAERRPEVGAIADVLPGPAVRLDAPARIDGGDVLRIGRILLVGLSSRTDDAGLQALARVVRPRGYEVRAVPVRAGLHLQSAVCGVASDLLLAEPGAIDPGAMPVRVLQVPPGGANAVWIGDAVVLPASAAATAALLRREGLRPVPIDLSEFEKGDAGATCLSLRRG